MRYFGKSEKVTFAYRLKENEEDSKHVREDVSRHRDQKMQKSKGRICWAFSRKEKEASVAVRNQVKGSHRKLGRAEGQDSPHKPP